MDPITYTIPEAAKTLKCNEENILYMGSRGAFSINILCTIFSLFYLKLPINIDEPSEYPSDFEVEVPWDEDSRIESNQMPLSPYCLTRSPAMKAASLAELIEVLRHKTLQIVKRYAYLSEGIVSNDFLKMNPNISESM